MGQSTNAILAFGFDLGEFEDLPQSLQIAMEEDGDFEWDKFLYEDYGIEPIDDYVKQEAALKQVPIEVIYHCSNSYPMYFLSVRGTKQTALRGYPKAVTKMLTVPDAHQALRDFCTKHSITYQEPAWHIFSYWSN
jgi:hypothetical protein